MLEDGEEGGVHLWHLVKATEEPEGAKARRSSLRERERERARAKAIPEIYLTRLLSMKVGVAAELEGGATRLGRFPEGGPDWAVERAWSRRGEGVVPRGRGAPPTDGARPGLPHGPAHAF